MATAVRSLSCIALLPLIVVGCSSESSLSLAGAVDRELGAAYFAEQRYDSAREALARVVVPVADGWGRMGFTHVRPGEGGSRCPDWRSANCVEAPRGQERRRPVAQTETSTTSLQAPRRRHSLLTRATNLAAWRGASPSCAAGVVTALQSTSG